MYDFNEKRAAIEAEYASPTHTEGLDPSEIGKLAEVYAAELTNPNGRPYVTIKSDVYAMLLDRTRIKLMPSDPFVTLPDLAGFSAAVRLTRTDPKTSPRALFGEGWGNYVSGDGWFAVTDFGHTVPDWNAVMKLGISGLAARVKKHRASHIADGSMDERMTVFFDAMENNYAALGRYMVRLREAGCPWASADAPSCFAEALTLSLIIYYTHWCGEADIRSLGGLDRLLWPFLSADLDAGRITLKNASELLKFYMFRLTLINHGANTPFYLCGSLADGSCAANPLTVIIIRAYLEMNVHNPKMQIRVATPGNEYQDDFLNIALNGIRDGMSALVFINDRVALGNAVLSGAKREWVHEYTPTGCYESTIMGREIACTETCAINILKGVEYAVNDGVTYDSFESFKSAVFGYLRTLFNIALDKSRKIETVYGRHFSTPVLSGTYINCLESGRDAYDGGADCCNSGVNSTGFGSLVDSLCAVKYAVFDKKLCRYDELKALLCENWEGGEILRAIIRNRAPKWGTADPEADAIATEVVALIDELVNNQPNGRGGVFKAGFYSIDRNISFGKSTKATPDGRLNGEAMSRNMSPDLELRGITAAIESGMRIDSSAFRNGGVVDVMLHPSAVAGSEGLLAFRALLDTFIAGGGFAVHFNVFDVETLEAAQREPEKYRDLQIRVCGWNSAFTGLSAEEQDGFIRRAKAAQR